MLKILGDFTPYGKEFISTYPHLSECSQTTRSLKATDFTKLLEPQHLRRTTTPPHAPVEQSYELSSVPALISTISTDSTSHLQQQQNIYPVDEELYVENNTVIWSRGRHIIKTFQYELQPVEMALFAWFPIDQPEYEDNLPSIDQLINGKKRKATPDTTAAIKRKRPSTISFTDSLLEAEQQIKRAPPPLGTTSATYTSLPPFTEHNNDKSMDTTKKLQKAACIILKDCVKIHFKDGEHHSIHLPFTVHQVIPSDIGLILERSSHYNNTNSKEKSKVSGTTVDSPSSSEPSSVGGLSASPFLCLVHPAEEFKPIFFLDPLPIPSLTSSLFCNGDSTANFFQQQQLVYASFTADHSNDQHDSPSPAVLVVTKSKTTGLHSIWRYQTVRSNNSAPTMDSSDDDEDTMPFSQRSSSFGLETRQQQSLSLSLQKQPMQDQVKTRWKQGRRSKKAQFGIKGKKRQQKQQQVSPDSIFGGSSGGVNNNSSTIHHSPSPSPGLTTRKDSFLAGSRSFIQGDEDISVLSSFFSGDNNSMLALYQDALDDNYGEKCQLQHLWTEERRPYINPTTVSKGFLSHNAQGSLVLCIMNETEGLLLGLLVKDLLPSKGGAMNILQQGYKQLVTGFHVDTKQALPLYNATRSGNVADILLLDHQNNLSIFIDPNLPRLPVLLSGVEQQQQYDLTTTRFIKIHDAVDNRFNLVMVSIDVNGMPSYTTKRCQIHDITAAEFYTTPANKILVKNSSMSLQCAWASSTLWIFFQHQSLRLQQRNTFLDGWEVFVTSLLSMIPLAPLPLDASSKFTNHDNNEQMATLYTKCMTNAYRLQRELQQSDTNYYITDPQNIAFIVRSLHVLYQDYCISKFIPKSSVALLGTLLWVLARMVRSDPWIEYYSRHDFVLKGNLPYQLDTTALQHDYQWELLFDRPVVFESWMHYHLPQNIKTSLSRLCGLPTLDADTPYIFSSPKDETLGVDHLMTVTSTNSTIRPRQGELGFKLKMLWYIHERMHFYLPKINEHITSSKTSPLLSPSQPLTTTINLSSSSPSSTTSLSSPQLIDTGRRQWIQAIVKKGYCRNDLEMIHENCPLLAPLLAALSHLQLNPPSNQSIEFYRLIGRNDMVAQLDYHQTSSVMNHVAPLSTYDLKLQRYPFDKKHCHQPNISQLIAPSASMNRIGILSGNTPAQPLHGNSMPQRSVANFNLSQFFDGDSASTLDTLKHVRLMLNPCHLVEMTVPEQPNISEENLDIINQGYLKDLIQRTLALSIGSGIFHYGHQRTTISTSLSLPPLPNTPPVPNSGGNESTASNRPLVTIEETINLSAKLLPLRRTVTWDDKAYRPEYFDWPRFHHGVATGLRLSSPRVSLSNDSSSKPDFSLDDNADDNNNDLTWLFYVEPEELNVFHGGLLFGLGLNGHLLPNLHWYRYITQTRCSLVTIGFILGTCVTFRGSKNTDITKILSVHVPVLLAPQISTPTTTSATLAGISNGGGVPSSSSGRRLPGGNDDLMTSSCLFGLGLIFMGSCDRYMASVMLNEIGECSKRADARMAGDPSSSGSGRPTHNMESACALAAGFALGFIMLGKGGQISKELGGLPDAQLFDTLYNYMTGKTTKLSASPSSSKSSISTDLISDDFDQLQEEHKQQPHHQGQGTQAHYYSQGVTNLLDITTPAATIALGLIYLKTENRRIADRLDIYNTTQPYLNYVRPDFLLLRIVAKNLILWQSITPSQDWIDAQLPSFMHPSQQKQRRGASLNGSSSGNTIFDITVDGMDEQVINQAKYNIVAGACLCLGLRFAGSQDPKAFDCLLGHFDTFLKLAVTQATTFQDHITKSAVWLCIDIIATAAAMVMAGTGNKELYKRLKILHDRVPFGGGSTGNGKYSNHMASHMAMGLLFCGLGRYTLKTTNEAVAGLLCSFYPFYPIDSEDQRSHLQAFRHLWVIGLDQRWLTPIDCDTKQPCQVPIILTSKRCIRSTKTEDNDGAGRDTTTDGYDGSDTNHGAHDDDAHQQQLWKHQCRLVAPSVVPNYDTLASIQLDSSLYYPLKVNMQTKTDYQQAIRQSGILFVQKKR